MKGGEEREEREGQGRGGVWKARDGKARGGETRRGQGAEARWYGRGVVDNDLIRLDDILEIPSLMMAI